MNRTNGRHSDDMVARLQEALLEFERKEFRLPGLKDDATRLVFVKQVIDSIRRVDYVRVVEQRQLHSDRTDPGNDLFDPVRAALIHKKEGDVDEACWLIFLFVHFGKHPYSGWRLIRDVYGKLGAKPYWTWTEVSAAPEAFRSWLRDHTAELRGPRRGFGNHRKYQSLDADKKNGTGEAIKSYVVWVMTYGGHEGLIKHAMDEGRNDPFLTFDWLYKAMDDVVSFGRTAKFDYLTMLGKAGLANIEPRLAHLNSSTGPIKGAKLLLESNSEELTTKQLETRLSKLASYLGVGMQAIEDSLCNWQKSPTKYELFSG